MGFPPHQAGLPGCAGTREHPQRGSVTPSPRLPRLSGPGEGKRDEMESAGLSRRQQPRAKGSAPRTAQESPEPELPGASSGPRYKIEVTGAILCSAGAGGC